MKASIPGKARTGIQIRRVAVLHLGAEPGVGPRTRQAKLSTKVEVPTAVVRFACEKRILGDSAEAKGQWERAKSKGISEAYRWVTQFAPGAAPFLKDVRVGWWGFQTHAGVGGGHPRIQGLARVAVEGIPLLLAASGKNNDTTPRWYCEPLRWDESLPAPCQEKPRDGFLKRDAGESWETYAERAQAME